MWEFTLQWDTSSAGAGIISTYSHENDATEFYNGLTATRCGTTIGGGHRLMVEMMKNKKKNCAISDSL